MSRDEIAQNLFYNRTGVLATMHQKERAIRPVLSQIGVQIVVPEALNTDEFGTFTREVERTGNQLQAARLKAEKAMALTALDLGFASEGSFGPHPTIPFLSCDRELVVLIDRQHDLEIVGQVISTDTNYSQQQVTTLESAIAFAQKVGFPSHGIVAMPDAHPNPDSPILKGMTDESQLVDAVTELLHQFGQAYLETDMRAMHNPTRMKVIAQATQDLVTKMSQCCPQCGYPGFTAVERQAGLPCALCQFPTALTLSVTHRCRKCDFSSVSYFPDGQEFADPAQCSYCNP
jgi:hypothetical protein